MIKRAEERALEIFPVDMQMCIDNTEEPYETDVNAQRRKYVAYGYEQAEKDLALTWEDVKILDKLMSIVEDENYQDERRGRELRYDGDEKFYGEVLRRFNKHKNK